MAGETAANSEGGKEQSSRPGSLRVSSGVAPPIGSQNRWDRPHDSSVAPPPMACPYTASCQVFAPRRGVFNGEGKRVARTPARRYGSSKGQDGEPPLAKKEFADVKR